MMAAFIIFRARMMTRFSASLLTRNDRSSMVLWFFYFAQRVASAALAGAVGRTRFFRRHICDCPRRCWHFGQGLAIPTSGRPDRLDYKQQAQTGRLFEPAIEL